MGTFNNIMVCVLGCTLLSCGAHESGDTTSKSSRQDGTTEIQLAPGAAHPSAIDATEGVELTQFEQEVLALLNQERKKRNLFELQISYELSGVARHHSEEMARAGNTYHDSPQTGGVKDRVQAIDFEFTFLAENVGAGGDPQILHSAWMNSKGHRKNLLHPDARQVGIGLAPGTLHRANVLYGTQIFASKAPRLDLEQLSATLIEVANKSREARGLSKLEPHKGLTLAAKQNLGVCFGGGQINLLGTDWHQGSVGAKLFTLASTENITEDDIKPMLDPEYSYLGLQVVQETDPKTGANMVCVILILGSTD